MDDPHPKERFSHRLGGKVLLDAIAQDPDAWTGETPSPRDPASVDATFQGFDAISAPCAGLPPLDDVDFGEFLPSGEFPPHRPPVEEDDIESLAEAALAGQGVSIDDHGNAMIENLLTEALSEDALLVPQPTVAVHHHFPDEAGESGFDIDASLRSFQPPTSRVGPLPRMIEGDSLEVCWSGVDNQGQAEGLIFDVFVATDDGPFELWQETTEQTAALFHGECGHRYAFFCVATDARGNREPIPDEPQAVIHLVEPAPFVSPQEADEPVIVEPVRESLVAREEASDPVVAEEAGVEEQAEAAPVEELPTPIPVRPAPELRPELIQQLRPVEVNTFNAQGDRVADFLTNAASSADPDTVCGIAVVGLVGVTNGRWEYSLDGIQWQPLAGVYHGGARLLRPDDRVRFLPRPFFTGSVGLTFRVWDGSSGEAGGLAALAGRTTVGPGTAFSNRVATATLAVVKPSAPAYRTDATSPLVAGGPRGCLVSRLTGTRGAGQNTGVAIVSLTGTADGRWQFSLDAGRTWRDFGAVFRGRARLLRGEDRVRFTPHGGFRGPARLIYHGWDGSQGTGGDTAAVLKKDAVGDGTPFGAAIQSASWFL